MGPSASRLSRPLASGDVTRPAKGLRGDEPVPVDPGIDSARLAERYRRAASRLSGTDASGPASDRLLGDPATRVARARAARELADPIAPTTKDPNGKNERIAKARANAASNTSLSSKPSTLRERAFANPKRARNAIRSSSPGAAASSSAINSGLNYGLGWPACAGGGIQAGCWDDGWLYWYDWCNHGWNSWGPSCRPHSWWYSHCGWYWPFGYSFWWWSSCWSPYIWYSAYTPATVVVYRDVDSPGSVSEAPPAYGSEPADSVGEGVIDDAADSGSRVVDESMEKLLSPTAVSASRAATQNLTLGDAAFREGRYGDAVHCYAKAIEFQPDQGVLYLVLSDALFATGDYHYGAYALRKALELDPTLVENPTDKHGFYADPQEFDRQLAVLEIYLKDRPTDQDARLLLAANYLFGMRPAAAVDLLELPVSETLRISASGGLLLEAARKQQYAAAKGALDK
ncbi:MAG TPA: hypothetical protein VM509_10485 [Planctomycetota bacterium]|nr:hypothetical protein [Planctomycetota bacterium]